MWVSDEGEDWATDSDEEKRLDEEKRFLVDHPYTKWQENQKVKFTDLPVEVIVKILRQVNILAIDDVANALFFVNQRFNEIITNELQQIYHQHLQRDVLVDYCFSVKKFEQMFHENATLTQQLIQLMGHAFSKYTIDNNKASAGSGEILDKIIAALVENKKLQRVHFYGFGATFWYTIQYRRRIERTQPQCTFSHFNSLL